jgi:Icc-related predicted phosphoesterase
MRIQIASDLHLEFLRQSFPDYRVIEPADADVLVLAGDIHNSTAGIEAFKDWPVPVIYVHGNHEAYGITHFASLTPASRTCAASSNVRYLECEELILEGVRFLGCCLWTDYCLQPGMQSTAMETANRTLKDYEAILKQPGEHFAARDALAIHIESRAWLAKKLDEPFAGPTVVITHHGPHPGSIHPKYAGNPVNPAFISDLTPLVEKASLWIHGHVHDSFDYAVGSARVVTNPRGYARNRLRADTPETLVWENPAFNPGLVVEIQEAAGVAAASSPQALSARIAPV